MQSGLHRPGGESPLVYPVFADWARAQIHFPRVFDGGILFLDFYRKGADELTKNRMRYHLNVSGFIVISDKAAQFQEFQIPLKSAAGTGNFSC